MGDCENGVAARGLGRLPYHKKTPPLRLSPLRLKCARALPHRRLDNLPSGLSNSRPAFLLWKTRRVLTRCSETSDRNHTRVISHAYHPRVPLRIQNVSVFCSLPHKYDFLFLCSWAKDRGSIQRWTSCRNALVLKKRASYFIHYKIH